MQKSRISPQFGSREHAFTVLSGEGMMISTKEHGTLFDAVAGYWYNILGMRHPELLDIKRKIGGTATHLYEEYTNPFAEELAESICQRTSMSQLLFSATGSMACENARKEAVKYFQAKGKTEEELVFAIKQKIELAKSNGKTIAGFFYEPIMGVRGSVPLPEKYITGIAEICRQNDILLIADEVTTGIGRAGKFFYSGSFNIKPDILCFGKAISAGHYPVAVTLFNEKIIDAWNKLEERGIPYSKIHRRGNSITGTQEGCALGLKVLEILERDNLIEQVNERGKYALEKLKKIEKYSDVREIRGTGLLIGIDIASSDLAKKTVTVKMRERGINILPEGRVIMFNPAYVISEEQIDNFVNTLSEVLPH